MIEQQYTDKEALYSRFAHFLGGFQELVSRNTCFDRKSEKNRALCQNEHSLGFSHFVQVGNEPHFIGVFSPKVGNTIHFSPKKMSEP
jgi:hypothetical protein